MGRQRAGDLNAARHPPLRIVKRSRRCSYVIRECQTSRATPQPCLVRLFEDLGVVCYVIPRISLISGSITQIYGQNSLSDQTLRSKFPESACKRDPYRRRDSDTAGWRSALRRHDSPVEQAGFEPSVPQSELPGPSGSGPITAR
jgi:hypothetical protein